MTNKFKKVSFNCNTRDCHVEHGNDSYLLVIPFFDRNHEFLFQAFIKFFVFKCNLIPGIVFMDIIR